MADYRRRRARTSERDFQQAYARIIGRLPDGAPISLSEMARLPGVNAGLLRELERIEALQLGVVVKAALKNESPKWGKGRTRSGRPSRPWTIRDNRGSVVPIDPVMRDAIKGRVMRAYADTRAGVLSRAGMRVSAESRARGRQVLRVEPPGGARGFIESVRAPKSRLEDRTAMSHRRAAERAARHGDAAAAREHKRLATNATRRANTARKAGK